MGCKFPVFGRAFEVFAWRAGEPRERDRFRVLAEVEEPPAVLIAEWFDSEQADPGIVPGQR